MSSVLQSIPSPTKIREELEQMVLKDLLGPAGGPEEKADEQSVRDRYLVGMLAPKRQELSPEEFDEPPRVAVRRSRMVPPSARHRTPRRWRVP
jgi:hypothetical protein